MHLLPISGQMRSLKPLSECWCSSLLLILFFKRSANEDDEVFLGAVGHKERCIAASLCLGSQVSEQALAAASGSPFTWSPLTGEKFVEVYKEAHLLALQIESHSRREVAQAAKPQNPGNQGVERFLQDSKLKISLFEKEQKREKSPTSLKRETFCLPSSGVQPLLGETQLLASPALLSSPVPAGPVETQSNQDLPCSSQPLPGEARTSQPPHQAGPLRRITSKLQPPRAVPVRGKSLHLATEKVDKTHSNGPGTQLPISPPLQPMPCCGSLMGGPATLSIGEPQSRARIWTVQGIMMGSYPAWAPWINTVPQVGL